MLLRKVVRQCVIVAGFPLAHALAGRPPKKISAMMRVKNEVEFLERSINSVINLVDELVIVDNGSVDGSSDVIADFSNRFPKKVKAFNYPYKIARYGEETLTLAATKEGKRSPSFLPNYYNWCAARCIGPYILKWDGDTIATSALATTVERFRLSKTQILCHTGINLHPDRTCYIAGRPLENMEPRLFFKPFSTYNNNCLGYVETLWSPYIFHYPSFLEMEPEPLYFHMKFCKANRYLNMSNDLQIKETATSGRGDPLPEYLSEQVSRLGLTAQLINIEKPIEAIAGAAQN
jgi:glycosyltransferase involved in cell wall biosynthesis